VRSSVGRWQHCVTPYPHRQEKTPPSISLKRNHGTLLWYHPGSETLKLTRPPETRTTSHLDFSKAQTRGRALPLAATQVCWIGLYRVEKTLHTDSA
jgi:hypothetical protein